MLLDNGIVVPLDISVEQGTKFFVSGGVAVPEKLTPKHISKLANEDRFNFEK